MKNMDERASNSLASLGRRMSSTRREFLKSSLAAAAATTLAGANQKTQGYLDASLPAIPVPHFAGERYEAEVPDTLDLVDVAELTIRSITRMLDPDRGYLMYGNSRFYVRPPRILFAGMNGGACGPKHLEGLPLLRLMSGNTFNIEIDKGFMESYLHLAGKDGCFYWLPSMFLNVPAVYQEPFSSVENEGRHILALCMWYQHDKNPLWKTLIEKKIRRLNELAIKEEDYAYFTDRPNIGTSEVNFTTWDTARTVKDPSGGKGRFAEIQSAHQVHFMLTRSLCVYYKLTGDEVALELAGKITNGVVKQSKGFSEDGRWLLGHFHTAAASLLASLEYALIVKDDQLIELVKKAYEFGKVAADPIVGYFPEYRAGLTTYMAGYERIEVRNLEHRLCETCEVADMTGLALKLTRAGVGDYWEDAERWVRNQLVENQLTADKLHTMLHNLEAGRGKLKAPSSVIWVRKSIDKLNAEKGDEVLPPWASDQVDRSVGSFSGSACANDWGGGSMHGCCTGNASRTLYWIWDSILTREGDLVRVNLLLNRCSPWLDLDSHLPYEGKVVLRVKEAKRVAVRIPGWTDHTKVTCKVNGKDRRYSWSGNYVEINGLKPGDMAAIEYPMKTETIFRVIGADQVYKLDIKGYTVVDIDPKGTICPLYQRDHLKQGKAPMKQVARFVSRENLQW